MSVKIVVSGLGAIGGYYGAMLARFAEQLSSVKVFFYLRQGEHLNAIRQFGLQVVSPSLNFYAHPTLATSKVEDIALGKGKDKGVDYLILATKEYDLKKNLKDLLPIIGRKTLILTTQNGLSAPLTVQSFLPDNTVASAACHITCRKTPGLITVRSDANLLKIGLDPNFSGKITPEKWAQIERLFVYLRAAGVRCTPPSREMGILLKEKFIMLSPSAAATAYYNQPIGEVMKHHEEALRELIHELAMLYQAMGNRNSLFIEDEAFAAIDKMPKEATTSMHSDIQNGHKSELESLVGFVVKTAKKNKLSVPRYEAFYNELKNRINS